MALRVRSVDAISKHLGLDSVLPSLIEESIHEMYKCPISYVHKVKEVIRVLRNDMSLVDKYPPNILVFLVLEKVRAEGRGGGGDGKRKVVKGMDRCRNCGSYDIIYKQIQTRSSDEGMTLISKCASCSKTWRSS